MSVFPIAAKSGRFANEFGFEELRLLKGSMPLEATYVPGLRSVFYASEAWMLRAALDGQRRQVLELDPFTLSTFQADDLLDFRQIGLAFATPAATWRHGRD